MRFSHYRDAIRQAITEALDEQGRGALALAAHLSGQALTPDEHRSVAEFSASNPTEAATLSMAHNASQSRTKPLNGSQRLSMAHKAS